MARPRRSFKAGDILFNPSTEKFFTVERLKTHMGVFYLLRSLESGNPGRIKSGSFIELQLQDGFLKRSTMKEYNSRDAI